jgi:hypothetical protein
MKSLGDYKQAFGAQQQVPDYRRSYIVPRKAIPALCELGPGQTPSRNGWGLFSFEQGVSGNEPTMPSPDVMIERLAPVAHFRAEPYSSVLETGPGKLAGAFSFWARMSGSEPTTSSRDVMIKASAPWPLLAPVILVMWPDTISRGRRSIPLR